MPVRPPAVYDVGIAGSPTLRVPEDVASVGLARLGSTLEPSAELAVEVAVGFVAEAVPGAAVLAPG
jgi:hypothetical protein